MKHIIIIFLFILSICIFNHCEWNPKKNNESNNSVKNSSSQKNLSNEKEIIDSVRILNDQIFIELNCENLKASDDGFLHFSYKVTNTNIKNMILYSIQYLDFETESFKTYFVKDTLNVPFYPRCHIQIIDDNNQLPRNRLASTDRSNEEIAFEYAPDSYIILNSGESKVFSRIVYLGDFLLKAGDYKLRLEYFSPYYEYFENRFDKEQIRNEKLKDYDLFQGIVSSNACPFELIVPIENPFLKNMYLILLNNI